jgi:hypothetical protein
VNRQREKEYDYNPPPQIEYPAGRDEGNDDDQNRHF